MRWPHHDDPAGTSNTRAEPGPRRRPELRWPGADRLPPIPRHLPGPRGRDEPTVVDWMISDDAASRRRRPSEVRTDLPPEYYLG